MCDSESSLVHTTSKTETQADHALNQAPYYLIIEKLRSGDVLLTRGTTPRAGLIAYGTKGQYSHAALWVVPKEGVIPILMEADSVGVGPTFLPTVTLTGPDGRPIFAYALSDLEAISLLRHPRIQDLDPGVVSEVTEELVEDVSSRRYSALVRLSDMLDTSYLRGPARKLFAAIDVVNRDPRGHQGIFCSELVAMYFERLSLPLFEGRPPSAMSPNHLAEAASGLQPVTDAIIDAEAARFMTKTPAAHPPPDRQSWVSPLVKGRHDHELTMTAVSELSGMLESMREQWLSSGIHDSRQRVEEMKAAVSMATQAGNQTYARKLHTYTCTQVFLSQLLIALQQDPPNNRETEDIHDRNAAHQYLIDTFAALHKENIYAFARAQILFSFSLIKLQEKSSTYLKKRKLTSTRRKLLKQWKKCRGDRIDAQNLPSSLAPHTCPTRSELVYRDKLLVAALAAAKETSSDADLDTWSA